MEKRRLRESILDHIESKDLTVKDLIARSGIPEQYLDAILNDKRDKLPAFPYVRVYLIKIAAILGLNPEEIVAEYKAEFSNKISGSSDTLPANRFVLPSSRRRYLIGAAALLLIVLGYALSNSGFFGRPHLALTMPPAGASDPYVTTTSSITFEGQIDAGDKLLINNQVQPVTKEGIFSIPYQLQPELNTVEFTVSRFLGTSITIVRHIYYEEASSTAVRAIVPPKKTSEASSTTSGQSSASSTDVLPLR